MARVSIGRVWDDTWAFLRAESALLAPLALATIGAAMLLLSLVIPDAVDGRVPRGAWLLWLLPVYALMLTGVLAISSLVLRPGSSVGESLRLALRRLPTAGLIVLMLAVVSLLASVPAALATMIDVQRGGAAGGLSAFANAAMLVATIWLWVRLLPMWAAVADGRRSAVETLRACFAMTRGLVGRLLGLTALAVVAGGIVGSACMFTGGTMLRLIGRAVSGPQLGTLLVAVLFALLIAAATTIWTVLIAFLYRQLGEGSA